MRTLSHFPNASITIALVRRKARNSPYDAFEQFGNLEVLLHVHVPLMLPREGFRGAMRPGAFVHLPRCSLTGLQPFVEFRLISIRETLVGMDCRGRRSLENCSE
jgi:hypothetical protein